MGEKNNHKGGKCREDIQYLRKITRKSGANGGKEEAQMSYFREKKLN